MAFERVANIKDVPHERGLRVRVGTLEIGLFRVDGEIFATQGECGHAYGPLGDGVLNGHTITCPLHEWEWDVRDGSCVSGEDASIKTVAVKIKKNRVMVQL
jgi:nitrite reductase/ring-hydroxylating ferredoxin subunit